MKKILSSILILSLIFSNLGIVSYATDGDDIENSVVCEEECEETKQEMDGEIEEVTPLDTQSMYWNFSTNYTLSGSQAANVVAVASAQVGRTQSSLGYTEAWCADFVCDVGRLAGVPSNVIPWEYSARGGVTYLYNYMMNYCNASRVSSRQAGDFVFYYCNSCQTYVHVGIVADSSYQIEGNIWNNNISQVYKYNTSYVDSNYHSTSSGTISRIYVRPNYSNMWYANFTPVNLGDDFYGSILSNQTGYYVGAVGGNVELVEGWEDNAKWHFVRQSDGSYIIYNLFDGNVIDVANAATTAGTNVQTCGQWGDDNGAQKWYIYSVGGGQYVLRSKSCDKVLDVSNGDTSVGTNLWIWDYNSSWAQKFMISAYDQVGSTTLSVTKGDSTKATTFSWTTAENATYYNLKIQSGTEGNVEKYAQIERLSNTSYSMNLPAGYYEAYVEACNTNGSLASNTVSFTIKGDTTKPVIDEDSLSVTQLDNDHMKVRVKVTDNVGVEKVEMYLYKMEIGNANCWLEREYWFHQTMTYNNGYYEAEYDGSLGKLGVECPVEVELNAYDTSGNVSVNYMNDYRADKTLVYTKGRAFFATEGQYKAIMEKGAISQLNHKTTGTVWDHMDFYTTDPEVVSVDENGKVTALKKGSAVVFVIRWNSNSTHWVEATYKIMVTDSANPFTDVEESDWFCKYVEDVYADKIMTGVNDTTFNPNGLLTRAEVAIILYRMNGSPEVEYKNIFTDVPDGTWYTDAIIWASDEGVVLGKGNGTFAPTEKITREQMALMLYRYAQKKGYDISQTNDLSKFPDRASVHNWALTETKWAVGAGLLNGTGTGELSPLGNTDRAQCATIISRFMEIYNE